MVRRCEREHASEPRERSAPAKRRVRERVGESEGRSPSDKTNEALPQTVEHVVRFIGLKGVSEAGPR
jgi:hypothetical protein